MGAIDKYSESLNDGFELLHGKLPLVADSEARMKPHILDARDYLRRRNQMDLAEMLGIDDTKENEHG